MESNTGKHLLIDNCMVEDTWKLLSNAVLYSFRVKSHGVPSTGTSL